MKKFLSVFFGILLLSNFQSCIVKYHEFGENSVFYYINDQPVSPDCTILFGMSSPEYYYLTNISLKNDTLRVHICGKVTIDYTINDFRGNGLYYINNVNGNTCQAEYLLSTYHARDNNRNTFLRVLEIDTIQKHFSAVFEADLIDDNNNNLRITKGRMDVDFIHHFD